VIELDSRAPFAGRYRVLRRIAAGGMGAVFEVEHIETQRRRALKVMLPELVANRELRARFQMEARITARVDSEYIVDVFDAGVDASTGMPFLVMELLQGHELGEILTGTGAVSPEHAVTYLRQVASALDKTHAANIVHRDLKPENLFLTQREDGTPRIKILDFGISKLVNEANTGANATRSLGTPLYMAPEQVLGQSVSAATDLYSLGLIAYTLLTGVSYWQADADRFDNAIAFVLHTTKGTSESAVVRAARLGRSLPPAFDAWFRRATHLEPTQRFRRASELVTELAAVLGAHSARAAISRPPALLGPESGQMRAPAISAPGSYGTAPGTGFDPHGTGSSVRGKSRKTGWLIATGALGVVALAGAAVLRVAGTPNATHVPAAASTATLAPSVAPPASASPVASAAASEPSAVAPPVAVAPPPSVVPRAALSAAPPHASSAPKKKSALASKAPAPKSAGPPAQELAPPHPVPAPYTRD
jgi:serine/threonine-protein kinase